MWHGMVSNEEVQGFMRGSDLFFFPSIMEATSTVLVEALMNRLPVLCFDTCGMGTIVDETVGCKIPLSRPGQSARDFVNASVSFSTTGKYCRRWMERSAPSRGN